MPIPDYETLMLPLLRFVSDGQARSIDAAAEHLSTQFQLTVDERNERIPSGQSTYIKNRTGWARTYLKKAGLLSSPKRGFIQLTDRGRDVLGQKLEAIDQDYLRRFPEFVEFTKASKQKASSETATEPGLPETPEESIEKSYQQLRGQLADELLEQVVSCSSDFFERLVVDLLVAMGYGGSFRDAAQATKRSNDGGIDGIIKEDKLGLDTIYIQAKKWNPDRPVHRPDVQKFAGALQGMRARKGIFITTSAFSDGAREFVSTIDSKIILIDGEQLAQLMIDHGVGVSKHQSYDIMRMDGDYFVEGL